MAKVFVTGATGFMGRRLCGALIQRGHTVRGLARTGSEGRLAAGVAAVVGDPLDGATYRDAAAGCDTMVHLVGVSHPSPAKAARTWCRRGRRSQWRGRLASGTWFT
jgi:nucleoside-diphosphate-sugar epimerase